MLAGQVVLLKLCGRVKLIEKSNHYYRHRFPLVCYYQRCKEPIMEWPFICKMADRGCRTHYYHVKCAEILRVI